MAVTTAQLTQLYLAYFGRPPDFDGITFYTANQAATVTSVAAAFSASPESTTLYGNTFNAAQINAIYQNLFNRDAEPAGLTYWATEVAAGRITPAGAAMAILQGAQNADKTTADNKLTVATSFYNELNTTSEITGYSGTAAAASARAFLRNVNDTAASVTTAQTGLAAAVAAAVAVGPIAGVPGVTSALTLNQDTLTGGAANDVFNALVALDAQGKEKQTLTSIDVIDGGAGTDTLNATLNTAGTTATIKNVEIINARFVDAAATLNLTSATGVNSVIVADSSTAGQVDGLGAVANITVRNQTTATKFDGSTATSLGLTFDNISKATTVDLGAVAGAKATTANITLINANVDINSTVADAFTTLSVTSTGTNTLTLTDSAATVTSATLTGAGSVDLSGKAFTGALTKFDASVASGAVKVDIQSTKAAAVTTGSAADTVDMDTAVVAGTSVDLGAGNDSLYVGGKLASFDKGANGGEGTDTINITDGATLDAKNSKFITNFETLDVSGGKGDYDVSLNSFATVQINEAVNGVLAAATKFINTADTFTLNLTSKAKTNADFAVGQAITVTLKDAAGTTAKGDAETFTLSATFNDANKDNASDGNIDATAGITVAGVETLVVQTAIGSTDGGTTGAKDSTYTLKANITAAAAETLVIKGAGSADLSGTTTIGVVSSVNATEATGNVTINFSTHNNGVAYNGGAGVDTYTASTKGDTIYTGKGADVVTLTTGVRDTFVLKAATDSQVTDTDKSGTITLGADTGFDAIANFKNGATATDDRLDVTNFAFSGAQRGVVDVSAKVIGTTNITSIASLFNDPAGNRGVAFSNLGGADTYVFVDVNKDGNFTAADDLVVKLTGITSISETNVNF